MNLFNLLKLLRKNPMVSDLVIELANCLNRLLLSTCLMLIRSDFFNYNQGRSHSEIFLNISNFDSIGNTKNCGFRPF